MQPGDTVLRGDELAAVIFDLDGVLTRTAAVHEAAWAETFDQLLARFPGQRPFGSDDYRRYVDGKRREDGIVSFLRSRGIDLPEGSPRDPAGLDSVGALARLKNERFRARLREIGVQVFPDARELVLRLRAAGMRTAVISASRNCRQVLEAGGLAPLFDARVDGLEQARLGLQGKPAPDVFLEAARRIGAEPAKVAVVEDALAGVEAARAGGFGRVIGVARTGGAEELAARGADVVVPHLGVLRVVPAPGIKLMPATRTQDPSWLVIEGVFTLAREHEVESILSIANGLIGSRGSLAEGSSISAPATFVAGIYHPAPGGPELVRIGDWAHLSGTIEGRLLRLEAGEALEHRRVLDMRQGIVWREWRHRDPEGRVTAILGLRLASLANRNVLVQAVTVTPENYSGTLQVEAARGGVSSVHTDTGGVVAWAVAGRIDPLEAIRPPAGGGPAGPERFGVEMELGNTYRLERVFAVFTSRESRHPERDAVALAQRTLEDGAASAVADHLAAWRERWDTSDVLIEGDEDMQRAIRFALYHLIGSANPEDPGVSIGARGLSGSGYRGHVFWDTEIYMLPFFTHTWPEAARSLLLYRHRTLPAARRRATAMGRAGALYAWESADTGEDVTPRAVIAPDGEVVPIHLGERAWHISADVAYGVCSYLKATGDLRFLLEAGAEILIETARFWASSAQLSEDGRHHLRGVIGPDEYHDPVDDDAYTNGMARWNLRQASRAVRLLARRAPAEMAALAARLHLDPDEPRTWLRIAGNLYSGFDPRTGVIEQFRGYFGLEEIDLAELGTGATAFSLLVEHRRLQASRVIKQPDVLMLIHLLWDEFPPAVREANFAFYDPRTAHGSSLSPPIHAAIAARLGHDELALSYLRQTAEIDLANNMGNAALGVHVGALGGLWQALVFGVAGVRRGVPGLASLPRGWRRLSFPLLWRGEWRRIEIAAAHATAVEEARP